MSEAERAARRRKDRERLQRAAEQLLTSEGWQRWVRVRSQAGLARLSFSNQLLVARHALAGRSRRPDSPGSGLMHPPTEPDSTGAPQPVRGDEDELYRRHRRELHRAVAHVVRAPRELIEDACQTAWAILIRSQPDRHAIFAWLRVVAIHEAYRLSAIDRRDARLEHLRPEDGNWHDVTADRRSLEDALEALEALRVVAALPERQRCDFVLKVAGYSYAEIRELTPGRSTTDVKSRPVPLVLSAPAGVSLE